MPSPGDDLTLEDGSSVRVTSITVIPIDQQRAADPEAPLGLIVIGDAVDYPARRFVRTDRAEIDRKNSAARSPEGGHNRVVRRRFPLVTEKQDRRRSGLSASPFRPSRTRRGSGRA